MTTIATHSGTFHADDIFAVALLELFVEEDVEVVRTRDEKEIEKAGYVVDVGGVYDPKHNRFDHHQEGGAGERENGIPYASLGLVWKEFGETVCGGSKRVAEMIDIDLVQPIDAADNGVALEKPVFEDVRGYGIHDIVLAFRPSWKEPKNLNERFNTLVSWAKVLLEREIAKKRDKVLGWEKMREIYTKADDKIILVLPQKLPWYEYVIEEEDPLIVVEPSSSGGWSAETVPTGEDDWFKRRIYFPESWAGKRDTELQDITGVEDAIFAHRGRFLAVAESKSGALALARKALKQAESPSSP